MGNGYLRFKPIPRLLICGTFLSDKWGLNVPCSSRFVHGGMSLSAFVLSVSRVSSEVDMHGINQRLQDCMTGKLNYHCATSSNMLNWAFYIMVHRMLSWYWLRGAVSAHSLLDHFRALLCYRSWLSRWHTRIVGMDPWDGLNGLGLGPGLDLNYLCHDLNQRSVS